MEINQFGEILVWITRTTQYANMFVPVLFLTLHIGGVLTLSQPAIELGIIALCIGAGFVFFDTFFSKVKGIDIYRTLLYAGTYKVKER